MSLQQKRTVQTQTQTSEPTWAKVVAQGKPSQSQNISVVSFVGYTNDIGPIPERGTSVGIGRLSRETKYEFRSDNGSILTQRAIEKKTNSTLPKNKNKPRPNLKNPTNPNPNNQNPNHKNRNSNNPKPNHKNRNSKPRPRRKNQTNL